MCWQKNSWKEIAASDIWIQMIDYISGPGSTENVDELIRLSKDVEKYKKGSDQFLFVFNRADESQSKLELEKCKKIGMT